MAKSARAAGVRVRMYRQGLGDCFLLSFPRSGRAAKPFHVLIDCGVVLGTANPDLKMKKVAQDIVQATGGHLDLLVVTHEHWDHVSGFLQAKEEFAALTIGAVWLAWTEDPNDVLANRLRADRRRKEAALRLALTRVEQAAAAAPVDDPLRPALAPLAAQAASVLGFFAAGKTADAMDGLRERKPTYLTPGQPPLPLAGVDGVRVFVLGPPRDLARLHKDLPTKAGKEVYELSPYAGAFFAAFESDDASGDACAPFEPTYRVSPAQAATDPFFQRRYGAGDDPAGHAEAWRRVDADWMAGVAEFALQLDSDTNNTSLVLAFELPDGRVLLFPGDAQVGNWESWADVKWDLDGTKIDAPDLLKRTALYKVGHHGSHNATLREKGLELMTRGDLIALLPVDEAVAHEKKKWKQMPFVPLVTRLGQKTNGRVLRSDAVPNPLPAGVTASKEKLDGGGPLYFDVMLT